MVDLLIAWVVFPAIQLTVWFGCGSLIARLAGAELPRALHAPLGFCGVIVLGGFLTAAPGLAGATTPLIGLLAVLGLWLAKPWRGGLPSGWLLGALAAVWAVYAAPIVLSGEATFAGYIKLDDTATWLALTDRVMEAGRSLEGLAPSSYEATLSFNLADGYPIGAFIPLGAGQSLAGLDAAWLIQPYMALLAVLLALALWTLARPALRAPAWRGLAVAVAAQPALLFGYYLWGGVKELAAAALIALIAALSPAVAAARAPRRRLLALAFAIAALVGSLSLAGAVWLVPLLALAGLFSLARAGPAVSLGRAAALIALVAVMIAPVLLGEALLPPTSAPLDDPSAKGNLIEPLSAVQSLGIWPAGDFRVEAGAEALTLVLCGLVALAAVGALIFAVRKRRVELVAYLAGVPLAAIAIAIAGSPWVAGKAYATASPVLLFGAMLGYGWLASRRKGFVGLAALVPLAAVCAGVAVSNALAYHEANLAPRDQLSELEEIAAVIDTDGPVLMTEYQPYGVRHFLREVDAEGSSELRRRPVSLLGGGSVPKGEWVDTDELSPDALAPYEALVLRRSPEQSRPPGEFSLAWSGDFYEVWRSEGPSAAKRLPLGAGRSPAATPSCRRVKALARSVAPGGSLVAARPPDALFTAPGRLRLQARVPQGTYSIWLAGSVRADAEAFVDGRRVGSVQHELNNAGLYAEVGEADLGAGRHNVEVRLGDAGLDPGTGGLSSETGPLAIAPTDARKAPPVVAAADRADRLCSREWDWIEAVPAP